jgi:uncharacterized protein YrrD
MARVIVTKTLQEEVVKRFKAESLKIFSAMKALEQSPNKGKVVGHVQDVIIKEIKYGKFRFYFITDGLQLKFSTQEELAGLLIKFVRMSEKKDQQKAIAGIKAALRSLGFEAW